MIKEAMEIIGSISPIQIFIATSILVLASIIILKKAEKAIKNNQIIQENKVDLSYYEKLQEIKDSKKDAETIIVEVDNLAREFFEREYQIPTQLDNSERTLLLKNNNKLIEASFCQKILTLLYSGSKVQEKDSKEIISTLESIINKIERKTQKIEGETKSTQLKISNPLSFKEAKKELKQNNNSKLEVPIPTHIHIPKSEQKEKKLEEIKKIEKVQEIKPIKNTKPIEIKQEKIIIKKTPIKKEKKTYSQIESIDMLDRIQSKIKQIKNAPAN